MQDKELNIILKKMWEIKEKDKINLEEMLFFNSNLSKIQQYYKENSKLWENEVEYSTEVINLML